ncbi:MAG: hypothetical protein ACYS0D_09090 [Planctomycetota bacterium]|jgi:hypothetical protein
MKIRVYVGVAAAAAIALCAGQVRVLAGDTECGHVGPDVIVGGILDMAIWGTTANGVTGYSIGTESCNTGDENLNWIAASNQHPVIAQNLYRYYDGRFEMIGLSWLKHGFAALTLDLCGCGCQGPGGSVLGVGCSDPYGAGLNGDQGGFPCGGGAVCGGLGPRSEVNPSTGEFAFPYGMGGETGNAIFKRMQVRNLQIDPALNPGARYYGEGQYVTPDDAAAGNHHNNASYREVEVGDPYEGSWILTPIGPTTRELPAIYAWQDNDPEVVIEVVDDQNAGRFHLGYRVTDNGDGTWHYEYALHNLNSHRAARELVVPVGEGVTLSNIDFYDKHHHSGDGAVLGISYDPTDWTETTGSDYVAWTTETEAENVNANALRWGVLYNYRFDADAPPMPVDATIGLYRAGTPSELSVPVLGPALCSWDLDGDGIVGSADLLALLAAWNDKVSGPPDFDGDGFVTTVDLLIMLGAWGPCPGVMLGPCGIADSGSCFEEHGTPGCLQEECCESVCAVEPSCCETAWDITCKDMANEICGGCGAKEAGWCCEPHPNPGCDDLDCCRMICAADAFCCTIAWDFLCADMAIASCTCL